MFVEFHKRVSQTRDGRGEGDAMGEAQYVIDQGM